MKDYRNPVFAGMRGEGKPAVRPGPGWKHIAGAVYEYTNGTRVHLLGMIRLPSGDWVPANKWPESKDADRFVRMNGGNWKRGLMAWAMAHNAKVSEGEDGK